MAIPTPVRALVPALALLGVSMGPAANAAQTDAELLASASVGGIYEGQVVQLSDGIYEGAPFVEGGASRPRVMLLRELHARGELGGPAGEELVALLAESSGGSGERIYVAAFTRTGDTLTNLGTALVGDRTKLRSLAVSDQQIVIDVVETGPEEAMCCGTQLSRKTYRLEPAGLVLAGSEVTGQLSLATWSSVEWRLIELDGKPLPDGSKPPTLQIDGDKAAGFGGCNRYSGAVTEPAPGQVAFGKMAVTMMACVSPQMEIEDAYLKRLAGVNGYTFLAGRLALAWETGEERGLLLFDRQ